MATLAATQRQTRRQLLEATRAMTEILADGATRATLTDLYRMAQRHVNERIAMRLDAPVGELTTIVTAPRGCPDAPHAHVVFLVADEEPDPDQRS